MKKRGRPPMDEADKRKWTTLTIERDVLDELNATADRMWAELGFRPTVNQVLKRILKTRQSNE